MIIYFYLFIPVLCRLAESSSIKGRNHKNDLVPFLSSRLDTQKDNSLKIVSNEPFIIQFQMPPQSKENNGAKVKDKKKKRTDKKRVSKIKPLRKKIRKRRDVPEAESREEKSDESEKLTTEVQTIRNRTENYLSRQEILKALNTHLKKKDTKKLKPEGMKNVKDMEKTDATSSRNAHHNHPPSLPDRDPHVKMIYPNTPKSDSHNYSYRDLISDRERLEQKINYIRNMLNINDTTAEDAVRIRRKSDSDKTANKIAKMFLTLSAVNGLHDKKPKCREDDDDNVLDIWEKDSKKTPSKQSSSSNEERYKVKKWIEYMKSKRAFGKTCPCMNEYNKETDLFPLEQKLAKGYMLTETGPSSEESSGIRRDSLSQSRGKPTKSGLNRNGYKEDTRSKLRALANRGRRKYEVPIDDLELYRSRAKQILQNAEEILDKIKEEEEKRLAAPHAIVSRLRELTSRIQGDPRNKENDLINIIQKNLGWTPQSKSQSSTDNNSFIENMKSFILDPYEKAKALTDESTKKLSSYLLRNLGKIDSTEEQEGAEGKNDQSSHVFHGQVPQTEGMSSASLAKENPELDSLAKEREEHQNWSDTISAILGGNDEDLGKKDGELKRIKDQEDSVKRRMEEIIKEQEKKIIGYTDKPDENSETEETTIIDLMTEEQKETPKEGKQSELDEKVTEMLESGKQDENIEKSGIIDETRNGANEKESETVKSTAKETGSDVQASEHQQLSEDQTVNEEFAESVGKNVATEVDGDTVRADFPLELKDVKSTGSENSPKEYERVLKYLEDSEELKSAQGNENQEEDIKDVVMGTATEFEKGASEERIQVLESSQERSEQDDNVQSKQDREENDVLNSKHLVQEDDQSEVEEIEEFKEDIQKLLENSEENTTQGKSGEPKGTVLKKEYHSSEAKGSEENVAEVPESVILQKQTETIEETQNEPGSENNGFSTGVVQATQDPKESVQHEDLEIGKPAGEKENSADGLVESERRESFEESEKTNGFAEDVVEKAENSLDGENERTDDAGPEETEPMEEETERKDDTLQSPLEGEAKKVDEEVREELHNQNDNEGKEIVRERLDDTEQDEIYQVQPSLKASLDESDITQKSSETFLQKSQEDEENLDVSADESTLRSENPEKEKLENSSGEISLKASKQNQEENEDDEAEKDEASLRESRPENIDEIQETSDEGNLTVEKTELDNQEGKDNPLVRAEPAKSEEIDGENEESPLKLENLETDSERSNESLMNTSESEEKVEAAQDETVRQENSETENKESADVTLKATADETDTEDVEEISGEVGKAEEQEKETETLVGNSGEANLNEEPAEVNNKPKLLMSIKEGLEEEKETMKANEEGGNEENDALIGDTLNTSQEEDTENASMNEEVPVRATNPETNQEQLQRVQDTQEIDDEDDINVRAENVKNLDNQLDEEGLEDGELRSVKGESEELNGDAPLREVNSLEQKDLEEDDVVEGVDQMKEVVSQQEVTVGKKKKDPASEEAQNYGQNQSKSMLKVPKSIGKIMRDLDGKEKDDYTSLTNLNPEKIDQIIDKIDEAEHRNKLDSEDVDCRKECACADEMDSRSRNIGRYEIVKDFLHWVKDLQLNRVLTDD